MNYNKEHLNEFLKRLEKMNISLSDHQINQFITYYEMLVEKNKVMNLTGITEFDQVLEKHFEDSLSLIQVIDLNKDLNLIDMGTGAGFPGLPLKIAFPNLKVTLADSLNKRIIFLDEVISELGLEDITTVHGRAEDLAFQVEYREKFDLCVSRAVANLSTLSEYCLPFVKVGGFFISYKSIECDEEVNASKNALKILGGSLSKVFKFQLGDSGRSFIIVEKIKAISKKYPRKAGTPSRTPLK